jgi:hypothetical protein
MTPNDSAPEREETAADPSSPARLVWEGGGDGLVIELRSDAVVVRSSKPFAPGSRPSGRLVRSGSEVRMKTHRCRRVDGADGLVFTLDGRLLDTTREVRAELEAATRCQPDAEAR